MRPLAVSLFGVNMSMKKVRSPVGNTSLPCRRPSMHLKLHHASSCNAHRCPAQARKIISHISVETTKGESLVKSDIPRSDEFSQPLVDQRSALEALIRKQGKVVATGKVMKTRSTARSRITKQTTATTSPGRTRLSVDEEQTFCSILQVGVIICIKPFSNSMIWAAELHAWCYNGRRHASFTCLRPESSVLWGGLRHPQSSALPQASRQRSWTS